MTGDMKWKGGSFARDRLRGAQAQQGVLWVLAGSLDSILRAGGVAVCWWILEQHWLKQTKACFAHLRRRRRAAWLLSLGGWFVGLSSGLSAPVV